MPLVWWIQTADTSCPITGVNKLKNLQLIEKTGGVDLTKKTQDAIDLARRNLQEGDTMGECLTSKSKRLQSGLEAKTAQKIRCEVDWAQHNLGREFEANSVAANQMRYEHYVLGESNIIRMCTDAVEQERRLEVMGKISYWRLKYDWALARNIYIAILRDLELGHGTWGTLDITVYKEMLEGNRIMGVAEGQPRKKSRDTWFCAAYQKGECKMEAPHMARVGLEERMVQHICSTCWLKEGKKAAHPNGGQGCSKPKA